MYFWHCVWAVNVQSCILSPGVCIKTPLWVSDTLAVPQNLASCLPRQHCRTFQTRLWWPNAVERSKFTYENLICVECTEASSVASFKCHDTKKQLYANIPKGAYLVQKLQFEHSNIPDALYVTRNNVQAFQTLFMLLTNAAKMLENINAVKTFQMQILC